MELKEFGSRGGGQWYLWAYLSYRQGKSNSRRQNVSFVFYSFSVIFLGRKRLSFDWISNLLHLLHHYSNHLHGVIGPNMGFSHVALNLFYYISNSKHSLYYDVKFVKTIQCLDENVYWPYLFTIAEYTVHSQKLHAGKDIDLY